MDDQSKTAEIARKALLHIYNSTVVGSINSIAMIVGIKDVNSLKNPRFGDLRAAYEALGKEGRREFYGAIAAIAEFAVYSVLDFVETYSRFDSEENEEEYPRLTLTYDTVELEGVQATTLSEFGSENLGRLFKEIARNDEVRALVDSVIDQQAQR